MTDTSRIPLLKRRLPFAPDYNTEEVGFLDVSLFSSESEKDDEWDEFLHSLEGAHHEQTTMWGHVKRACGRFQSVRFLAFKGGKLLGGCQILHKKILRIFHVGYICYGPQWAPMDEKLAFWLNGQLVAFVRALGIQYVYADFPYDGFRTAEHFDILGFQKHLDFLPPSGRLTASVVIDLSLSEDELLSRMRATTRKHIKTGLRSGVVVKMHVENAPELFTDLMWKLCQRRGCAPTPPERDFFTQVQESFQQSQQAHFFFAFLGEEAVSSLMVFTAGDWVRCWKIGWSGAHPKEYPNEVLWWEVIKWAKKAGYAKFDFVWIERECAEALIAGSDIPDTPYKSVALFKLGFGSKPVLLPLPVSTVFSPMIRTLLYSGKFHMPLKIIKNIRCQSTNRGQNNITKEGEI
jgi:lipid II:glycine glycyltransferase (peptidoglycan interpeptide bridge formation enzyme)